MELGKCSRCKDKEADVLSRKELFCQNCFLRFIYGKQRKQMSSDKYKVKFNEHVVREKVVLPLSFGKNSLVLLDVLIGLFDEQMKNPRAKLGFEINVVHIDDSKVRNYHNDADTLIRNLKEVYHIERYPIKITKIEIQSFMNRGSAATVRLLSEFTSTKVALDGTVSIERIFEGCPNRASKQDLIQIIIKDLINNYSVSSGASSILWGHSMSSLANEVIALTVKGRGSEIYSNLTDGAETILGKSIDIIHPLRDCSDGEIDKFIEMKEMDQFTLQSVDRQENLMNKQKTINEVVSNYYKTVDGVDDNIVSTVVKTGAKLDEPTRFDGKFCSICDKKIYNDPMNWLKSITNKGERGPENEMEAVSLQEWETANKDTVEELKQGETVNVCYGCAVTMSGFPGNSITWPVNTEKKDIESILDEFIIGSEEE